MWTYNYTDELYHHGVKGMKWGVRRANRKALRAQRRADKDAMKEEKRNSKNLDATPKQKSIGKTIVSGILTDIGVQVAGGMASGAATSLGHDTVAYAIKMGTIGASVGIKVQTVRDAIAAGKHNNRIRNS